MDDTKTPHKEDSDWEYLVSAGMEAREQKDASQWRLGELADKVKTRYGTDAIGDYAATIGVNKRSLLRYRDVYRAYLGFEINHALSFTHHMRALQFDDPQKILDMAYENSWSVEKMMIEMGDGGEKKRPPNPHWCSDCAGWRVGKKEMCSCK